METIPWEPVDGHVIALADDLRLLIDTGAPTSVGNLPELRFGGRAHRLADDFLGISIETLAEHVGTPLDALVGTDILAGYDLLIDPAARTLLVSEEELSLGGTVLETDEFMGVPVVEAAVGDETVPMFLDTGARLSYLHPSLAASFPRVGEERDFYPGMGEFTTVVHRVELALGPERFSLAAGILPPLLQATLLVAGVRGILGTALLASHRLAFAFRRRRIALAPIDR